MATTDVRGKPKTVPPATNEKKDDKKPACYRGTPVRFHPDRLVDAYKKKYGSENRLAKELGVSSTTVNRWKREEHGPRGDGLIALALTLGVSPFEFYNLVPPKDQDVLDVLVQLAGDAGYEHLTELLAVFRRIPPQFREAVAVQVKAYAEGKADSIIPRI